MNLKYLLLAVAAAIAPATAFADIVTLDFQTATITGVGTANGNISQLINVSQQNPGLGPVDLQLDVSITSTGGVITQSAATGLGVGDAFISDGESLSFDVVISAIGPHHVDLATFDLTSLGHGTPLGLDIFGGSVVIADDNDVVTSPLILNTVGPTSLVPLSSDPFAGAQTLTVSATGGATLDGLSSLSFNATAAPEPTSAMLCGLFLVGTCLRRRRRQAA